MSLIGDGIGHVAFAGVAAGYLLGVSPVADRARRRGRSARSRSSGCGPRHGRRATRRSRSSSTPASPPASCSSRAAGALNVEPLQFLFGSILTVTRGRSLRSSLVLGVGGLAMIALLYRALVAASCSTRRAPRRRGARSRALNVVVAVLAALTVARLDADRRDPADRRADGAAGDRREPDRLEPALDARASRWRSGSRSVLVGLTIAYYADLPPGGTIVLAAAAAFGVASAVSAVTRSWT